MISDIPVEDNRGKRHPNKKSTEQLFEGKQKRREDISREELESMTVQQIRQAVRRHNLHFAIKGYSKLRKADLIDKFLFHHKRITGTKDGKKTPPATRPNQQILKKRTEQLVPGSTGRLFPGQTVIEGAEELFNKTYKKKDAAKTKEEKLAAYRKHVAEYIKNHPESAEFLNDRENEERDAADWWKTFQKEQKKLKLIVSGKRKKKPTQKVKDNAAQAAQAAQAKKTVTKKPQRPKRKITETVRLKESKEQNKKKTATKKPKKKGKTPDMFKTTRL